MKWKPNPRMKADEVNSRRIDIALYHNGEWQIRIDGWIAAAGEFFLDVRAVSGKRPWELSRTKQRALLEAHARAILATVAPVTP